MMYHPLSLSNAPSRLLATFGRLAPAWLPAPAPAPAAAADSPPAASLLLLSGDVRFELVLLPGVSIFDDDDLGAPKKLVSERCGMIQSGSNYEFAEGRRLEGVFALCVRRVRIRVLIALFAPSNDEFEKKMPEVMEQSFSESAGLFGMKPPPLLRSRRRRNATYRGRASEPGYL